MAAPKPFLQRFLMKLRRLTATGSTELLPHLIRQMKDLREPMHILMDCCPSFFTVPVFKSRIRPKNSKKKKIKRKKKRRCCCTGNPSNKTSVAPSNVLGTGRTRVSPVVPLDAFSVGAAASLVERHQGLVPSTKGRVESESSAGSPTCQPFLHLPCPGLLYL